MLMHMKLKVTLLDCDCVIAPQRKLIPLFIGGMRLRENDFSGNAVSYSGPMYFVIRSGKHSGSGTYHHPQVMNQYI